MKNFLIAALIIGLGVSLYFNCTNRTAKPNENVRSFEIGKDSIQLSLKIPAGELYSLNDNLPNASFVTMRNQLNTDQAGTTGASGDFVAGVKDEIICADPTGCDILSLKKGGIQTPPNIIKDKLVRISVLFDLLRFRIFQKNNGKQISTNK